MRRRIGCSSGCRSRIPSRVSIGVVFPNLVAGKVEGGGFVEAGGEAVAGGLATGGVAAPASGVHPMAPVPGSVGVDGDQADVSLAQLTAPGVGALDAGAEGDVVVFGYEEIGIVSGVLQLLDDGGGDLPGVAPFVVTAVREHLPGVLEPCPLSIRISIAVSFRSSLVCKM